MSGVAAPHHDQHPVPDPQESLGLLPCCLFWGHLKQILKAPDGAEESTPRPRSSPPPPRWSVPTLCGCCSPTTGPTCWRVALVPSSQPAPSLPLGIVER